MCAWTINGPHLPEKGRPTCLRSLVPRPRPAFRHLQYGKWQKAGWGLGRRKAGQGLGTRLNVMVIHCTGCISVNVYQASRAAQGSWRRLYLMRADLGQEGAIPCIAYVQLLVFFPQVLSVQPVSGYIQPQQSTACRFTFCSYSSPSFYNMDILCKVSTGISLPGHWQW